MASSNSQQDSAAWKFQVVLKSPIFRISERNFPFSRRNPEDGKTKRYPKETPIITNKTICQRRDLTQRSPFYQHIKEKPTALT